MLHMPSPMLLNASGKTYADWMAHVNAQVPNTFLWNDIVPALYTGAMKTTAAAPTGGMLGTSWGGDFAHGYSVAARLVQHGAPDQTTFDSIVAQGALLIVSVQWIGGGGEGLLFFSGRSRNGFTSDTAEADDNRVLMTELSWWDASLGKPRTINPYNMTVASDYTARGWSN